MTTALEIINQSPRQSFAGYTTYYQHNRKLLIEAGYNPVQAKFNEAGRCVICGECGRCPGWHLPEEVV